jgi:hypothetical protein
MSLRSNRSIWYLFADNLRSRNYHFNIIGDVGLKNETQPTDLSFPISQFGAGAPLRRRLSFLLTIVDKLTKLKLAFKHCIMSRPALNKVVLSGYRVKPETVDRLRNSAIKAGYTHGKGAAIGEFLDAIAQINPLLLAELTKQKNDE